MTVSTTLAEPSPAVITVSSDSTFLWPMRLLPRSKRQAVFSVYAYCRCLDDIADEPGDLSAKRAALEVWREQIQALPRFTQGQNPIVDGLAMAMAEFALPKAELEALIDGMAMDLDGLMQAPTSDMLSLYCRRVAGAVGMLAVRIFDQGNDLTDRLALTLGEALQLTNILRDLEEDSHLGRLYLPADILTEAGIQDSDSQQVLRHPALPLTCNRLADRADALYAEAERLFTCLGSQRLWAARAMMILYRRLLARQRILGWRDLSCCVRLGKLERFWVSLRCALGQPPAG